MLLQSKKFTRHLLKNYSSEMGLFKLKNCRVSNLIFKSRFHISEFSGYRCSKVKNRYQRQKNPEVSQKHQKNR